MTVSGRGRRDDRGVFVGRGRDKADNDPARLAMAN